MPIRQDLYIALVLAVLGTAGSALAEDGVSGSPVDRFIAGRNLGEPESQAVRTLIERARTLQASGDETGAATAMAEVVSRLQAG